MWVKVYYMLERIVVFVLSLDEEGFFYYWMLLIRFICVVGLLYRFVRFCVWKGNIKIFGVMFFDRL